jgi:hypothetical protein
MVGSLVMSAFGSRTGTRQKGRLGRAAPGPKAASDHRLGLLDRAISVPSGATCACGAPRTISPFSVHFPSSFDTTQLAGGTSLPAEVVERTPRRAFACAPSVGDFALCRPAHLSCVAGHQFGALGELVCRALAGGMAFGQNGICSSIAARVVTGLSRCGHRSSSELGAAGLGPCSSSPTTTFKTETRVCPLSLSTKCGFSEQDVGLRQPSHSGGGRSRPEMRDL